MAIIINGKNAKQTALYAAEKYCGKVSRIKFRGKGSFGAVYSVDTAIGRIAVKIIADPSHCAREAEEIALLRSLCAVTVPKVFFSGTIDETGYIGMEYVEGICLKGYLAAIHGIKRRKAFAEEVAEGVYSLLCRRNEKFGDREDPKFDRWQDCYRPTAEEILRNAKNSTAPEIAKIIGLMEHLYERFDDIFSEEVPYGALIHGDLCPKNMLVNPFKLRLTGFIDPLNMRFSDPEYELFQLFSQSGRYFRLYETYKERYPCSQNVDIKTCFYALFAEAELFLNTGIMLWDFVRPLIKRTKRTLRVFETSKLACK